MPFWEHGEGREWLQVDVKLLASHLGILEAARIPPYSQLLLLRYGDRCAHLQRGAIDGEGASG